MNSIIVKSLFVLGTFGAVYGGEGDVNHKRSMVFKVMRDVVGITERM